LGEQDEILKCRLKLNLVLRDLVNAGWITIYPNNGFSSGTGYNAEFDMRQIIMDVPVQAKLNTKGQLEYNQLKELGKPKGHTFNIGENKGQIAMATDNATQSLDNARISPHTQYTTNNNPANPPKRSWLEILAWIVGIIAGIIAIWEFGIKKMVENN
jgi:hypothetical protein